MFAKKISKEMVILIRETRSGGVAIAEICGRFAPQNSVALNILEDENHKKRDRESDSVDGDVLRKKQCLDNDCNVEEEEEKEKETDDDNDDETDDDTEYDDAYAYSESEIEISDVFYFDPNNNQIYTTLSDIPATE